MIKLSEADKLYISKLRARVVKHFPNCYLSHSDLGYTIMDANDDDILSEYFLPMGKTPVEAWELAVLTAKTTQNFNRSHPERLSLELDEDKTSRISNKRMNK